MSLFKATSIALNIAQNKLTFKLEPIEFQSIIFKKKLFSKTLNSPKDNSEQLENYRTTTVKCLYSSCS